MRIADHAHKKRKETRLSIGLRILLILLAPLAGLAQSGEIFLNQGTLRGNPILLEEQRLLVQINDQVSFWDIDRNMLLKRYSAGNQFMSGASRTEQLAKVSEQGYYLLTYDLDSLYLYHTRTQTKNALPHSIRLEGGVSLQAWFSADEKTLILFYEVLLGKKIVRGIEMGTMRELDLEPLNRSLDKKIIVRPHFNEDQLLLHDGEEFFQRLTLGQNPSIDSFRIASKADLNAKWDNFLYWREKDMIVLGGSSLQGKEIVGLIGLADPKTGKLVKRITIPFRINRSWYPELANGQITVLGDRYDTRSFQPEYRYVRVDLLQASGQEGVFPNITSRSLMDLVEIEHRNGLLLLKCHKEERSVGLNLRNGFAFPLPFEVKLNWLSCTDKALLYRDASDQAAGTYTVMNTWLGTQTKLEVPYAYLHLSPFSQSSHPYIIRKYPDLRYELSRLNENMESTPYKRLQLRPDSLVPYPAGQFKGTYYFSLEKPAKVMDNNLEFDSGLFELDPSSFGSTPTRPYFTHQLDSGRNRFVPITGDLRSRLYFSNGLFVQTARMSEYGFTEPDSLFLLQNNNAQVLAVTDKATTESLLGTTFGISLLTNPSAIGHMNIDRKRNKVVFSIYNDIHLLRIQAGTLSDARSCNIQKNLANGSSSIILKLGFCNQDKNVYVIYSKDNKRVLHILDTSSLRPLFKYERDLFGTEFLPSPTSPHFLVRDKTGKKTELRALNGGSVVESYAWSDQQWLFNDVDAYFSSAAERFALLEQNRTFGVYETKTGKPLAQQILPQHIETGVGLFGSDVFYFISNSGYPVAWTLQDKKLHPFDAAGTGPMTVQHAYIDEKDSLLITTARNAVYWWHLGERRLLRTALLADTSGTFLRGDSGYYSVNKTLFNEVLYRAPNGNFVGPIQQFDIQYNRPSFFIDSNKRELATYRTALEQAYQKRIRREGVRSKNSISSLRCDLLNKREINTYLSSDTSELHIGLDGTQGRPIRLHVLVNGVPIYGQKGARLAAGTTDTTVRIALTDKENELVIYGTDDQGNSTNYFPIQLVSPTENKKSRIHFVGIGIDRFADAQYNLMYSSKDVRDLAAKLKQRFGPAVMIDTLFNEQVTLENIRKLKSKLARTTPADKVIISYSGHGLLNKDYDYFLSTYPVNFQEPQQGGLPYADMENLLDSIPARRKLLLIDACHSGEIDREETLTMTQQADSLGLTKGLIQDADTSIKPKVGLQNSFELMRELFTNVGAGTGTMVISAAAGNQFALERGDLKNGVFTFSILEALDRYDTIKAGELRRFVSRRVTELTKGLQQPTVRNENQARDWQVW